jgi:hypothetical protein
MHNAFCVLVLQVRDIRARKLKQDLPGHADERFTPWTVVPMARRLCMMVKIGPSKGRHITRNGASETSDARETSDVRAGDHAPRLPDHLHPVAVGDLALGSIPPNLLQPTTLLQLPLSLPACSSVAAAVPMTVVAPASGVPAAATVPPCRGDAPSSSTHGDGTPARVPPRGARVAGVPYRSPGTVFLEAILSMFHSMVASSVSGTCKLTPF